MHIIKQLDQIHDLTVI